MSSIEKSSIRKEMLEKLASQKPSRRVEKSKLIKEKLFCEEEFKKAGCVMFYVSMSEEVDTGGMIDESLRMGKEVCVPVIMRKEKALQVKAIHNRSEDLEQGLYGIYQPKEPAAKTVPLHDIDAVIVPGVVFDKKNMRIGRGHGYYDRFLRRLSPHTKTIGLAFDFQVVESLPSDPHDVPVDKIIAA